MKNIVKITLIFTIFLISACAGTGTKNLSAINFEVLDNDSAVFVVRKKRYTASAQLIKIVLDGQEVAQLGVGEMERVQISPGSHKISAQIGNILGLGIQADNEAFIAEKGKSYFFIADYDQGFFTSKWSLTPTTKTGFQSVAN
jgi:hypothetical protein